ncbi:TIGR03118 family protein [Noviherbaspirillum sp.]|uniref:TIGR03118 family protein n=1 Tax=Noviherbaspirillum sp. TaxID=1926288 RepID=UPI002B49B54F|nr:TIGR03118 family protein [Noviherbaspirillum sp.]HJV79884.1 TIGR03118 family protein [Noviherbaspirillum sp.]
MDTRRHRNAIRYLCALSVLACIMAPPAQANGDQAASIQATGNFYQQHNLVSDGANPADNIDPNLINSWGVAFNPFGPVWVADNGTGVSTLYDGNGKPQSLVVQIPGPANASGPGTPTGIVFNASTGFVVSQGGTSGASKFIFATEDGVIAAWAPNVDATHAVRMVDNSVATGAVYKGLALSAGGNGSLLYAADFHNNRIDVFDTAFKPVTLAPGAFSDPGLPAGFAPFGLQAIGGDIYVAYAKQDAAKHDDVAGEGLGFIDVYDPNGTLLRRLVSRGKLNSPWGMALAPAGFGKFSGRLLVGNFGDGLIHAYDIATGDLTGTLKDPGKRPIKIDGLWGLAFGNGFNNQPVNTLFFAAGPGDEKQGLYGRIDVAPDAGQDSDQ